MSFPNTKQQYRSFFPVVDSITGCPYISFAVTTNGDDTRTETARLYASGKFSAVAFGIHGGADGVDFSGAPGSITVAKGIVTAVVSGGGLPVADTQTLVKGSADSTKLLRFEVDGFTTATTRVLTPINKDYTIEETGHAAKHKSSGSDSLKLDELAAPTDVTALNVSSTLHGLTPKSPADATKFLNGDTNPAFALVKDSDLSTSDVTTNNVSSTKHGFAPKTSADATTFLNGAATSVYAQVKDSDLSTSDITTNDVSTAKHGFQPKLPNDASRYMDGTGSYSTIPALGTVWSSVINESGASLANWTNLLGTWTAPGTPFHVVTGAAAFGQLRFTAAVAQSGIVFQADVNLNSTGGSGADNRVGLHFSFDGTTGANGVAVFLRCSGSHTPASTGQIYSEQAFGAVAGPTLAFNFALDTYYTLKVVAIGNVMDIYVDGVYKTTRLRNPAPAGAAIEYAYVGIVAYNTNADFKNVKMYSIQLP